MLGMSDVYERSLCTLYEHDGEMGPNRYGVDEVGGDGILGFPRLGLTLPGSTLAFHLLADSAFLMTRNGDIGLLGPFGG